ncbi:MAG: M20/M25/M40 family metallo-hydrolase [Armatimonadetes bacterium]|nr:M20/M25/M40 family metallo-hydrolase [Armatimonadota bacterium]
MVLPSTEKLLCDLVALPSVNPEGGPADPAYSGEQRVAEYLADFWRCHRIDFERYEVLPGRENVIARVEVPGRPVLLLEGHMDTIPPHPEDTAPFTPRIQGERLYGLGACDAKASLAAMMWAVASAARDGALSCSVIMAATVDEEHSFCGATALINRGLRADEAIVGEPTGLQVVVAHKGAIRWRLVTHGRAGHSSAPISSHNAIYRMARLVEALQAYATVLEAVPPHPLVGTPSLSVGTIAGGTRVNVVPDRCQITVDRRLVPGEAFDEAEADLCRFLRRVLGEDFHYESQVLLRDPPLEPDSNRGAAARVTQAARKAGVEANAIGLPYCTNASKYAASGVASVVFGPGEPAQAHAAEEWVALPSVQAAASIYRHCIAQWT